MRITSSPVANQQPEFKTAAQRAEAQTQQASKVDEKRKEDRTQQISAEAPKTEVSRTTAATESVEVQVPKDSKTRLYADIQADKPPTGNRLNIIV